MSTAAKVYYTEHGRHYSKEQWTALLTAAKRDGQVDVSAEGCFFWHVHATSLQATTLSHNWKKELSKCDNWMRVESAARGAMRDLSEESTKAQYTEDELWIFMIHYESVLIRASTQVARELRVHLNMEKDREAMMLDHASSESGAAGGGSIGLRGKGIKLASPPKFDGKNGTHNMDVELWISNMDAYNAAANPHATDEQHAAAYQLNLDVPVFSHLANMFRYDDTFWKSTASIKLALIDNYQDLNTVENARDKLCILKMSGTNLKEYHRMFMQFCAQAKQDPASDTTVSQFFRGLNNSALKAAGLKVALAVLRRTPGCTIMQLVQLADTLLVTEHGPNYNGPNYNGPNYPYTVGSFLLDDDQDVDDNGNNANVDDDAHDTSEHKSTSQYTNKRRRITRSVAFIADGTRTGGNDVDSDDDGVDYDYSHHFNSEQRNRQLANAHAQIAAMDTAKLRTNEQKRYNNGAHAVAEPDDSDIFEDAEYDFDYYESADDYE